MPRDGSQSRPRMCLGFRGLLLLGRLGLPRMNGYVMCSALLLGVIALLTACTSSEPPAAKAPPAISPEVAAASGRLYLDDGRVEPADRWWEDGNILFYEWKGELRRVLRSQVTKVEGVPRPDKVLVGPPQTQSTLGSVSVTPPAAPSGPSREELTRNRLADCVRPRVGDDASYMGNYLQCVAKHGLSYVQAETKDGLRWELRDKDGRTVEIYEVRGQKVSLAAG
jgi:hypothetical protein